MSRAYQRISHAGRIVDTACGKVQYTEFGEGSPMLMVHGSGGGCDQGEHFAQLIGGDYHWIVPSRFGFLGSPVPPAANSARQADTYACLLDSLAIDHVGVVGISMGGPSALLFAARHPQRTRSLVIASAASHAIPPRAAPLATMFDIFLRDIVFWSMVHGSPRVLLAALGVPLEVQRLLSPRERSELKTFLELIEPMGARRRGQVLEQRMSEYDTAQIRSIQAPTMVVHARDDTLVPFEHGAFAARSIAGSELVPMDEGGHLALTMDRNIEAMKSLRGFLEATR